MEEQIQMYQKKMDHYNDANRKLIRREMYQYKFLGRLKDGSEYWAEKDWRDLYSEYIG